MMIFGNVNWLQRARSCQATISRLTFASDLVNTISEVDDAVFTVENDGQWHVRYGTMQSFLDHEKSIANMKAELSLVMKVAGISESCIVVDLAETEAAITALNGKGATWRTETLQAHKSWLNVADRLVGRISLLEGAAWARTSRRKAMVSERDDLLRKFGGNDFAASPTFKSLSGLLRANVKEHTDLVKDGLTNRRTALLLFEQQVLQEAVRLQRAIDALGIPPPTDQQRDLNRNRVALATSLEQDGFSARGGLQATKQTWLTLHESTVDQGHTRWHLLSKILGRLDVLIAVSSRIVDLPSQPWHLKMWTGISRHFRRLVHVCWRWGDRKWKMQHRAVSMMIVTIVFLGIYLVVVYSFEDKKWSTEEWSALLLTCLTAFLATALVEWVHAKASHRKLGVTSTVNSVAQEVVRPADQPSDVVVSSRLNE
eukprot:m.38878 g.38878  ORF g.38878 m.38878 type:complete len:428 (-) comp13531_c0_seq1:98-1381(-)